MTFSNRPLQIELKSSKSRFRGLDLGKCTLAGVEKNDFIALSVQILSEISDHRGNTTYFLISRNNNQYSHDIARLIHALAIARPTVRRLGLFSCGSEWY